MGVQEQQFTFLSSSDYRKKLKDRTGGAYVFLGEEEYMKKYCVTQTRESISDDATIAAMNINVIDTSTDNFSSDEILNSLSVAPVMNDLNLTEINGLSFKGEKDSKGDAILDFLDEVAADLDESNILIVNIADGNIDASGIEKGKPSKAVSRLSKRFTIVYFKSEDIAKLKQWISKHFIKEGIAADLSLCETIINRCGSDMFVLDSETNKLCEYLHAGGRDKLTKEDIELITSSNPEYGIFDFTDAILKRDSVKAYDILRVKKTQKESPEIISASINSLYSNMLMIKTYEECGLSPSEISKEMGIHEFRIKNMISGMRGLSRKKLESVCEVCMQADLMIKGSPGDKYLHVERLLGTVISMINN